MSMPSALPAAVFFIEMMYRFTFSGSAVCELWSHPVIAIAIAARAKSRVEYRFLMSK
jgi:hypothetical protein